MAVVVCDGVSTSGEAHVAAAAAAQAGVDAMLAALSTDPQGRTAVLAGLTAATSAASAAAGGATDPASAPSCTYTGATVVTNARGEVRIAVGNVGTAGPTGFPNRRPYRAG